MLFLGAALDWMNMRRVVAFILIALCLITAGYLFAQNHQMQVACVSYFVGLLAALWALISLLRMGLQFLWVTIALNILFRE